MVHHRWDKFLLCEACGAFRGNQCIGKDGFPKPMPCDSRKRIDGTTYRTPSNSVRRYNSVCTFCKKEFDAHVNAMNAKYPCCRETDCIIRKEKKMKLDRIIEKEKHDVH